MHKKRYIPDTIATSLNDLGLGKFFWGDGRRVYQYWPAAMLWSKDRLAYDDEGWRMKFTEEGWAYDDKTKSYIPPHHLIAHGAVPIDTTSLLPTEAHPEKTKHSASEAMVPDLPQDAEESNRTTKRKADVTAESCRKRQYVDRGTMTEDTERKADVAAEC